MGVLKSKLIVSLLDRTGAGARSVKRNMASMKAAQAGLAGSLAAGGPSMTHVRRGARNMRAIRTIGGGGSNGAMAGMGATAGALGFLANEMNVQQAMNRTQAILNITDKKAFKPHKDLVVDLAKRYPATSAEIAKGASELAMAGMTMKEVNEVLETTVQGSMASGESIKTVGQGVTDVVMGLGKELNKGNFEKINNVLAAAGTSYAQTYTDFLAGLAKTAPLARMQGMEVERLAGMLGILADANFKGAKGGTALRTSMINASAPTKKAQGFLNKYLQDVGGISAFMKKSDTFQLGGKRGAKSLSDFIASELGLNAEQVDLSATLAPLLSDPKAFNDLPKLRERLTNEISNIFGTDAETTSKVTASVNRFLQAGFQQLNFEGLTRALANKGFDKNVPAMKELFGKRFVAQMGVIMDSMRSGQFEKKMDEIFLPRIEGAVKRFAKILMQGLPGAVKRLGGAFDGLMRAMADSGAIDTVVGAMESLRDAINWLGTTSPGLLKAMTLGLLGLGVLAPIGFALSGVAAAFTLLGSAIAGTIGLVLKFGSVAKRVFGAGKGASAAGAAMAGLFGAGAGAAAVRGTKAGRKVTAGMSAAGKAAANSTVGAKMIAGMTGAAGVGAVAGKGSKIGAGLLKGGAKLGMRVLAPLALGMTLWDAYQGYQKGGALGALKNAATLGMYYGSAEASEVTKPSSSQPALGSGRQSDSDLNNIKSSAQQVPGTVQSAMDQVRSIVGSVNLEAEGRRMMESLAAGIRAGIPSVAAASSAATAAVTRNAVRGSFSDGGQ